MRSTWSLERVLAVLAAAGLEAAWLTLAYLLLQGLSGIRPLPLGIGAFAVAAAIGIVVSRALRSAPRSRYAAVTVGVSLGAAVLGTALGWDAANVPGVALPALAAHPGGWLLGLAVWRGTIHAEFGDEADISDGVLRAGLIWLIVFWVIASATGMVRSPAYTASAFVATLAFAGAGLLSLGLARVVELEVESVDRAARRRWLVLIVLISTCLLTVSVPVGAVLGLPVAEAVYALVGPLTPYVLGLLALLVLPFALGAELLANFLRALLAPNPNAPLPTLPPDPGPTGGGLPNPLPSGAVDLAWLGILALVVIVAVAIMVAAALVRQPGAVRRRAQLDEERAAEPIAFALPQLRPRLHLPRSSRRSPSNAQEAYLFALAALAAGPHARRAGETPREHAARVDSAITTDLRRLAADYQLATFGARSLTHGEQRRALERWRRISQRARST